MSIHDVACLEAKQSGRLGQGRCGIKPLCMQELELASEDAKVYKLIGPTLIKQDPVEAKSNVNKRLEFIQGELSRLDARLADYQSKAAKRQQQVIPPVPMHAAHVWLRECQRTCKPVCAADGRFTCYECLRASLLGDRPISRVKAQQTLYDSLLGTSEFLPWSGGVCFAGNDIPAGAPEAAAGSSHKASSIRRCAACTLRSLALGKLKQESATLKGTQIVGSHFALLLWAVQASMPTGIDILQKYDAVPFRP